MNRSMVITPQGHIERKLMKYSAGLVCTVFVLIASALVALPAVAGAEGSPTIAAAPFVEIGVREEGNTANGTHLGDPNHGWNQFYKVRLKAGDSLIINWETFGQRPNFLGVLPVGTSDFTLDRAVPVVHKFVAGGKTQLRWTATGTGVFPIVFRSQAREGEVFAFTARVKHRRPRTERRAPSVVRAGSAAGLRPSLIGPAD